MKNADYHTVYQSPTDLSSYTIGQYWPVTDVFYPCICCPICADKSTINVLSQCTAIILDNKVYCLKVNYPACVTCLCQKCLVDRYPNFSLPNMVIDPKIQESVGLYSIHLHSIKIKILVVLKRSFYIWLWVILIMIIDILIIRIV